MEEELKSFAAEDESLQKELKEINKAIQGVEASINQAEAEYNRHKSDAERELSLAENFCSKEIEAKDQQIAASTAELEQLEHDLSEFGRNNPQEVEIMHLREDVQRTKMENDMIRAEINQIQQSNTELRRNGESIMAASEDKLRKEQMANEAEDEKTAQDMRCLEKKLRSVDEHVRHLEQQRSQLEKQTIDREKEIDRMQSDIQSTKQHLREKETAMKEMCELIDKQEALEREMDEKYDEDVRQLERRTDDKIRDIKNQMMICAQKKQDNMAKIRGICQEIKDSKEKLRQAEINAQDTFKTLKCLTEEYETIKRQNERSEEFIAFYDAIRSYETKYVELKAALARAKDQRDFLEVKDRERKKDALLVQSPTAAPYARQRQMEKTINGSKPRRFEEKDWREAGCGSIKRQTGSRWERPKDSCRMIASSPSTSVATESNLDVSRRSAMKDPLADPFIQAYIKVNKARKIGIVRLDISQTAYSIATIGRANSSSLDNRRKTNAKTGGIKS
ncbi:hypothetical protein BV898_11858 [Hypsibius exemplaris]|uniref:Uncharacterized protein n=1 Tax=Hypsibius exemplaris TaxID=2072580 RepID=A0A1W0WFL5_HYPEX|nr:hypothetical protein BV898_11858 [Hypsibius exemplaris]